MIQHIVVDANVLWNFACIDRVPLLLDRLGDRMVWSDAVHDELQRHVSKVPYLSRVLDNPNISEPLSVKTKDLGAIARVRGILADPGGHPLEHLGEAECIHLCESRPGEWRFLTDDLPARDLAARRGLSCMSTLTVLQECFVVGEVGCPEAWHLMCKMRDVHSRGLRVPRDHRFVCPQ